MPARSFVSPPSSPLTRRKPSLTPLTRNIDEVVFGSILFDTWYYSPYPDPVSSEKDSQHHPSLARAAVTAAAPPAPRHGAKSTSHAFKVDGDAQTSGAVRGQLSCHRLHVCPWCFAYSPAAQEYVTHLRYHCTLKPSGSDETQNGSSHDASSTTNGDGANGVPSSATKVYDHEGYAVWEVDGDIEKLYCQNLSLFGKLFLEQKSVFFDVGGFYYYVLTYTPPPGTTIIDDPSEPTGDQSPKAGRGTVARPGRRRKAEASTNADTAEQEEWIHSIHSSPQALGFFSKEKLSWDSNNLACIVVFPPYQHRSLGKLLMSVSYKLSGWEWEGGVIGGPEKPLSAMGKKSYSRFWEERVARYLLGESRDADGRRILDRANASKKRRSKASKKKKKKDVLTVKEIGDRTGMLPEDVVAALIGMGVCDAPRKGGKKSTAAKRTSASGAEDNSHSQTLSAIVSDADREAPSSMTVKRSKVLEWVEKHKVDLKDQVVDDGFLGEWALSDHDVDEDTEMEDNDHDEGSGDGDISE